MSPLMPPLVLGQLWSMLTFIEEVLFLGPFTSPPVLIGTLVVLLLVLVVGRVLIGLAWRLVLIALVIVIGLWLLGALGTGFNLI